MVVRRTVVLMVCLAAALLVALPARAVGAPPVGSPASPSTGAARGQWLIRPRAEGDLLVWRSPTTLPVTDGRPQFRVGADIVGYPEVSADGRSLTLPAASLGDVAPSDVEVWIGVRRLDRVGGELPAARPTATPGPVAEAPESDPAEPGPFAVESFDYTGADLPWPAFDAPMEVLGHAVLPAGVPDAPLVVFLHGRHLACYAVDGGDDPGFWPCVSTSRPVPSYRGYAYLQRRLASQGYATVSISANGVNAQDGVTDDGGAGARSALVRHHLELLAAWSADTANPRWGGRLDPDRVVLVGHSRGGEGVDQAAVDTPASAPYRLAGQVLLAPTDFAHQTAGYLPTEVLLSYCDGDVSDLEGQRYVEAAPLLAPDDPSLRSSVLLLGANHNFYNTEWTPGISRAPSMDDWWDDDDPVCGRRASPTRLTASEQRRAAQTFVAAGVHAFLGDQVPEALEYLDSGTPVAVPEAGPAVALTHALGGHRSTVRLAHGATAVGAAAPCRAGRPVAGAFGGRRTEQLERPPLCGVTGYYRQPHWTPDLRFPASVYAAYARHLPRQVSLEWDSAGVEGGFDLSHPLDLTAPGSMLDLRVVVDPDSGPVTLQVELGSEGELRAGPARTLSPLPGSEWLGALWGQTIRVDPAGLDGGLDLAHVDHVVVRAVSDAGRVWLLDVSARQPGLAPVPEESLPVVRLGRVVQAEGGGPDGVALVPFRVSGTVARPAAFAIAADQFTWGETRRVQLASVPVVPGQTTGSVAVRYEADSLDDLPRQVQLVHAVPTHGVVTSGFVGYETVRDDDPAPTVTLRAARPVVRYGEDLRFVVRMSAPVDYYVANTVRAVRGPRPPLRTSDVPRPWLRAQVGSAPRDVPLFRVWHYGFVDLPPGLTATRLVVPTRARPVHERPAALAVRFTAQHLPPPLRAVGRVTLRAR